MIELMVCGYVSIYLLNKEVKNDLKNTKLPQVANALMNAIHEEEMEIINELYDACLREDGEKVEPLLEFLWHTWKITFNGRGANERGRIFAYPCTRQSTIA
jgi:hemerythrin